MRLGSIPHCFAGETPTAFPDGSYGCQVTLDAQKIGVQPPGCAYGVPFIDPSTEDWACPTPPAPQKSNGGGIALFVIAAAIAVVAWQYFVPTTARASDRVLKGHFEDLMPRWLGGKK